MSFAIKSDSWPLLVIRQRVAGRKDAATEEKATFLLRKARKRTAVLPKVAKNPIYRQTVADGRYNASADDPYHLKCIALVAPTPPLVPLAEPNRRGSCFLAASPELQAPHSNDAMSKSIPAKRSRRLIGKGDIFRANYSTGELIWQCALSFPPFGFVLTFSC